MNFFDSCGINWVDGIVVVVLLICFLYGKHKGAIAMILNVVYYGISLCASFIFYPLVSGIIRGTSLFDLVQDKIAASLNLEQTLAVYTKQQEVGIIEGLSLPDPVKEKLLENNNSVIYDLVGADTVVDYVTGFLANIVINLVLVWLLFAIFMMALRFVCRLINKLSRLPIINGFNRLIGAGIGITFGCFFVWLAFLGVYAFITKPWVFGIYMDISSSLLAGWFYNNNPLLGFVLNRLF